MARIYLEGGGDSKELHTRCREGFRKLLEQAGFAGRMPRLVACGGRRAAFDDFCTGHGRAGFEYVALLVDSEEPVAHLEQPWAHLRWHDGWQRPRGASNHQALLMITCMETWIACDPAALRTKFGPHFSEDRLPPLQNLESRPATAVLASLFAATRDSPAPFSRGVLSFEVLGLLSPDTLRNNLRGFARVYTVLNSCL